MNNRLFVALFAFLLFLIFLKRSLNGSSSSPNEAESFPEPRADPRPKVLDLKGMDYDPEKIERAIEWAFPLTFDGGEIDLSVFDFERNSAIDKSYVKAMKEFVEDHRALQQTLEEHQEKFSEAFNMSSKVTSCKEKCQSIKKEAFRDLMEVGGLRRASKINEEERNTESAKLEKAERELKVIEEELRDKQIKSEKEINIVDAKIKEIDQQKYQMHKRGL